MRPDIFLATIGRGSNGSNALEVTEDRAAVTAESQDNIINRVNNVSQYGPSWHYVPGIGVAGTAYAEVPDRALGDLAFTRASSKTRTNAAGLIQTIGNNVPPHDYRNADGTLSTFPRLNLEPQRINSMLYSQAINSWAQKSELTITDNNTISPDGTQNASYIQQTTGGNAVTFQSQTVNVTTGQIQTISFFAKAKEITSISLRLGTAGAWPVARPVFTCNLTNGTITLTAGTGTVSSQNMGNGWYRFIVVTSAVILTTGTNLQTLTGAVFSPTSGAGFYLWGVQWEQNATYPTTYIPTTTAAVTRIADAASKTGVSSLINSQEGVLFAEIQGLSNDTVRLAISDGTNSNNIYIELSLSNASAVGRVGAVNQFSIISAQTLTNNNKIAIKYKTNDFSLWINGVQVGTDTSGSTYSINTLNAIRFDRGDGGIPFYGNVRQMVLFPTALTNAQLAELTTL